MDQSSDAQQITIESRLGVIDGFKQGRVAWFDYRNPVREEISRHFALLDEHVKLVYEFGHFDKAWYVDVIRVTEKEGTIALEDLWIDFIIEADGPTYRVIDLDDLADVVEREPPPLSDVTFALRLAQRFVDTHIHRSVDFPPKAISHIPRKPGQGVVKNGLHTNRYPFVRRVNQLAREAAESGGDPFAALLVKDDTVVAHSLDDSVRRSDPTRLAELALISDYCSSHGVFELSSMTLYTNTEPCIMSAGAILCSRIGEVVFSVSQRTLQSLSGGRPKPAAAWLINSGVTRVPVIGPLLEEEGTQVFMDFPIEAKLDRHLRHHHAQHRSTDPLQEAD